ncbi:hypothetical protein [Streptomyces sp. NPDC057494]|uniref:hypothetical protein n=1 Tax=Streptomyces sp. NPDC057494 TaxID=3346148 RepID=UPI0036B54F8C
MSGGQSCSAFAIRIRTAVAAGGHAMPALPTFPHLPVRDDAGPVAAKAAGGAGRHGRVPAPTSAEAP